MENLFLPVMMAVDIGDAKEQLVIRFQRRYEVLVCPKSTQRLEQTEED